jgi:hypothetical protein
MEDIKRVISFDSVEEFWGCADLGSISIHLTQIFSLYNNIVPPSQLPQKANYYLFKVSFGECAPRMFLNRPRRRALSRLGKTRRTRTAVNGVFNCRKTRIGPTSTRCGYIRYVDCA